MSTFLPIDVNSRPVPALAVGFGKTYSTGVVKNPEIRGRIVRIKAISDSTFKLLSHSGSEIVMGEGDLEYFVIPANDDLEIITGSLNIMW